MNARRGEAKLRGWSIQIVMYFTKSIDLLVYSTTSFCGWYPLVSTVVIELYRKIDIGRMMSWGAAAEVAPNLVRI